MPPISVDLTVLNTDSVAVGSVVVSDVLNAHAESPL